MSELQELKELVMMLAEKIEKQEKIIAKLSPKKKPEDGKEERLRVREAFTIGYYKRFGHEYPTWGPKENNQVKQLVAGVGLARALWLIDWYLVWTDPFVVQAGHPLGLLITSIVKMEAQLNRKGRYFDQVAASRVTKKIEMGRREMEQEINVYAEKTKVNKAERIGFQQPQNVLGEAEDDQAK